METLLKALRQADVHHLVFTYDMFTYDMFTYDMFTYDMFTYDMFTYDMGDDWRHSIADAERLEPEPGAAYPRPISAGACPLEDIGGVPGHPDLLDAINDPEHEDHEEYLEMLDGPIDPERADVPAIKARLQELAWRWSRAPRQGARPSA